MTEKYQRFTPYNPKDLKPRVRFDWKECGWYVVRTGAASSVFEVFNALFGKSYVLGAHEDGRDHWGPVYRACAIPFRKGDA